MRSALLSLIILGLIDLEALAELGTCLCVVLLFQIDIANVISQTSCQPLVRVVVGNMERFVQTEQPGCGVAYLGVRAS